MTPPAGNNFSYQPTLLRTNSSPLTRQPTSSPSPRVRRSTLRGSGYSLISDADAKQLVASLLLHSSEFKEKRRRYVAEQRSSREAGKADIVNKTVCLEVAGEKSHVFEETVSRLGIFDEDTSGETHVVYKKVPRPASQQKYKQPERDEEVLTYLFSRWMHVDSDSVKLFQRNVGDPRIFKAWSSVKYMNCHGIYCELFVISSEFNRHLFHRQILV